MKTHYHAVGILSCSASLLTASLLWGAEPARAKATTPSATTNAELKAQPASAASGTAWEPAASEATAPAQSPSPPAPSEAAAPTPTVAPTTAPVTNSAVASPNSVEASPYGNAAPESPASNPAPAPPARGDAPATLFDSGTDYAIGGFGGIGVMYTRFIGGDRPLVCGEGAVIIDHKLTLGGGGCGVAAMMDAQAYGAAPHSTGDRLTFGYGGAIARYHFFSREPVNFAVGGLVGAGGIEIKTWKGDGSRSDWDDWDNYSSKSQDPVFVFEPQVGGFANITRWLRVAVIGGYRFVSGVDVKGLRSKDLMGPVLGGQIQAGWF
ncbi:MAG TPA: hypothetical protein VIV60_08285 [Polyangiaceae bacterium]